MNKKFAARLAAVALTLSLSLTACTSGSAMTTNDSAAVSSKADAALKEIQGKVLNKGPHGREPSARDVVMLFDAEVAQVKAKGAAAAIVIHYTGNDWATVQVNGLKAEFVRLGTGVVAITDVNFSPGQQVSNIETVLAKKPDIIISIPTDPVATASAYKRATEAGMELVFMDNAPNEFVAGKDYESVVSAGNYGNGVVSAHLPAKALGGEGKVGVIYREADFFVTKQRYQGFIETIAKNYPGMKVVKAQGIAGPDFAGDTQKVTDAMLSQNPDLASVWAVWDVPVEGVMAATRSTGRTSLKTATEDLGTNAAIAPAQNQLVAGLGTQQPYQRGVTEANVAGGALLGKKVPAYVVLDALPVDHPNALETWEQMYNVETPANLQKAYVK